MVRNGKRRTGNSQSFDSRNKKPPIGKILNRSILEIRENVIKKEFLDHANARRSKCTRNDLSLIQRNLQTLNDMS
jgi:hypothetical protein